MTDPMKAVVLPRFGGADAFELRDVSVPRVESRQVRVRVHATAVNPLDYQIRRGDYADHVPLPAIIGHDISGVVEEVGSHVTEFRAGDAVYYTPRIFGGPGSYAEQHIADVDLIARKPHNINHLEAASLTLVGGTVWEALVTRAQLAVHETILIHGGAGGVGTVAIQLAKAMGARVITTARRSNHEFVRSLGADEVIDYTFDDYVSTVADLTHGKGVNVVFDTIGGDTLTKSPLALADAGHGRVDRDDQPREAVRVLEALHDDLLVDDGSIGRDPPLIDLADREPRREPPQPRAREPRGRGCPERLHLGPSHGESGGRDCS